LHRPRNADRRSCVAWLLYESHPRYIGGIERSVTIVPESNAA
jgi:hypothetical protein